MTRTLVRAALLAAIYLLVLTSLAPGDVLVGAALGLGIALALRGRGTSRASAPLPERLVAALALLVLAAGAWPEPLLALSRDAAAVLAGGAP